MRLHVTVAIGLAGTALVFLALLVATSFLLPQTSDSNQAFLSKGSLETRAALEELKREVSFLRRDFSSLSEDDSKRQQAKQKALLASLVRTYPHMVNSSAEAWSEIETPLFAFQDQESPHCGAFRYEGDVWISLTTTPARLNSIQDKLQALAAQTYPIAGILLALPSHQLRTGQPYPPDPPFLSDGSIPKLKIVRTADRGPLTKVLAGWEELVLRESLETAGVNEERDGPKRQKQTRRPSALVVVDDDVIYSPELVCDYVKMASLFPGAVLTRRGQRFRQPCDPSYLTERLFRYSHDKKEGVNFAIAQVDLVNGVGSYWLPDVVSLLDQRLRGTGRRENCPSKDVRRALWMTDDIVVSGFLAMKGVLRVAFSHLAVPALRFSRLPYSLSSGAGSLFEDVNKHSSNNELAVRALGRYWHSHCRLSEAVVEEAAREVLERRNHSGALPRPSASPSDRNSNASEGLKDSAPSAAPLMAAGGTAKFSFASCDLDRVTVP
uniref:Uncharacterized protein n=1 Tax=Chromera velia CCMP2878 TaxID=1169474 RepID=A0A0G4GC66_9ALVE|eukprot:Cvel_21244.t1-p1 / transcript=Cvel_21244.t1 / gene=Cvel_21244 / organism=Chromera_velia_CCMP2878 / gene_product=hypothetical protein / transcript_product=hypothetical protein / location=Cvel_scaffold1976:9766-12385(-) / protein_length=494 / sequence_SO=supercontig / SO=protein_coding / is_pseudo=false